MRQIQKSELPQNLVENVILRVFFTFPSIFSLLRVVWPYFFFSQIALGLKDVFNMWNISLRWFFAELEGFKAKVFRENEADSKIRAPSKSGWERDFKGIFNVSFDIFTSTCRMTLIFFLTDRSRFEECFQYVKHISSMIFRWARGL